MKRFITSIMVLLPMFLITTTGCGGATENAEEKGENHEIY